MPLYLKDVTEEERDELRKQKERNDMLKRFAEGISHSFFCCPINPDVASHVHDAMSELEAQARHVEAFRAPEITISADFSRLQDSVRELSINVQNIYGLNNPNSVETAVGSMMMSADREVGSVKLNRIFSDIADLQVKSDLSSLCNMVQDEIIKCVSSHK